MKSKILLLFLTITIAAYSQEVNVKDVPQSVLESFEKEYSGAKIIKWEMKNDIYFAIFKSDDQQGKAEFDKSGPWKITHFKVSEKELPSAITSYCQSTFPGFKISNTEYIETVDKTYYFIEMKKEGLAQDARAELNFDITGKLLKREDFNLDESVIAPQENNKQEKPKAQQDNKPKTHQYSGNKPKTQQNVNTPPRDLSAKVPATIKNAFTKKFPRAENVRWDTINKTNYIAIFKYRNEKQKAEFLPNAKWLKSITVLEIKNLYPPIKRYIEQKFPDHKIKYAEMTTNNQRKSYFYLQVSQKVKSDLQITQLYFDKSGKLDKIVDPIYNDEPLPSTIDEEFDQTVDNNINSGKGINDITDRDVKAKELPTPIANYIKTNYIDYKVKNARFETDSEFGQVYYVVIKRDGVIQPEAELWFNTYGKLLKKIDENTDEQGEEENQQDVKPNVNIPEPVQKTFKDKYNGAMDIKWDIDENNIYVAEFTIKGNKTKAEFTNLGVWNKTSTETSDKMLPPPITSYLVKNFKSSVVQYAEFVEKKDKKNFYYVELVGKKKGGESANLYFTTAGRLMKSPESNE